MPCPLYYYEREREERLEKRRIAGGGIRLKRESSVV